MLKLELNIGDYLFTDTDPNGQALSYTAELITVGKPDTNRVVAELNYAIADAMLAARARP